MWHRLARLFTAGLNISSFYANPSRYLLGVLSVLIIPYLAYIFWGTIIILALIVLGIYLLYLALKENRNRTRA